jgi:16S rRNA (cytidine1402-2'-O)-methyltransferase
MDPGLYIIGTPIGNLEDITYRAVRTLQEIDLLLAEDTRQTGILLQRYDISKPMLSCHEFNEQSRVARVLEEIQNGRAVGLVSDAGMPLISDPGSRIVRAVREAGLPVTSIPGPTALTTALALSGWGGDGFVFAGFPPNKSAGRRRLLESFRGETRCVALYESTHRIEKLFADIQDVLGDRPVFMARELTKKFETLREGTGAELAAFLETHSSKGEFVVLLGPLPKVKGASVDPTLRRGFDVDDDVVDGQA